jgi:excisionase family DNA binding protein
MVTSHAQDVEKRPDTKKPPDISSERKAIFIDEFQRFTGLSRSSVDRAIASGEIRAFRIGGRWLIPTDELDRLLHSSAATHAA